jgi:hypothetical protein
MPCALTLESRPGYLQARVIASNSPQTVLASTQDLHDACIGRDLRAVPSEENL